MDIHSLVSEQKAFFDKGETLSLSFRLDALSKLKKSILDNKEGIIEALKKDLYKAAMESYMTEIGIVLDEIGYAQKHLKSWMKVRKVKTPLVQFKSKSFIVDEPYGLTLIISPWNYPFQLALSPLVGAISGGNTSIIKPSSYAPNVSGIIKKVIGESFSPSYIAVVEGGRAENTALLNEKFDYVFFTGSVEVGKVVMEACSRNLTPLTLELGGKSPVIVEKSADIKISARRIAFGKILNSGQTCVAPDYLLIDEKVKDEFIREYKIALDGFFPNGDYSNFPSIINEKHFKRLIRLMEGENIIIGGDYDEEQLKIKPALIALSSTQSPLMGEEIFGPILPFLTYNSLDEVFRIIKAHDKPLAFYLFTRDKRVEELFLSSFSFGGGCINDTIIHLASSLLPFGGVGASGMGSYHGNASYDTFTHSKSIVRKSFKVDLPFRYHPYNERKQKLVSFFLK